MFNHSSLRLSRTAALALLGLVGLLFVGCGTTTQFDPAGTNSGSPQFAAGTFNFSTNKADVVTGGVNQTLTAYDTFTSVNTDITVTSATTSTTIANMNADTQTLESGEQFLVLTMNLRNRSVDAQSCANPTATKCVEYLSPLSNFRLIDTQGRVWPSTTGAMETCSHDAHTMCSQRSWVDEALNGIAPTMTFTARLAFVVPVQGNFTLYFAPYRFSDTSSQTAGGTSSGQSYPTVAAITV